MFGGVNGGFGSGTGGGAPAATTSGGVRIDIRPRTPSLAKQTTAGNGTVAASMRVADDAWLVVFSFLTPDELMTHVNGVCHTWARVTAKSPAWRSAVFELPFGHYLSAAVWTYLRTDPKLMKAQGLGNNGQSGPYGPLLPPLGLRVWAHDHHVNAIREWHLTVAKLPVLRSDWRPIATRNTHSGSSYPEHCVTRLSVGYGFQAALHPTRPRQVGAPDDRTRFREEGARRSMVTGVLKPPVRSHVCDVYNRDLASEAQQLAQALTRQQKEDEKKNEQERTAAAAVATSNSSATGPVVAANGTITTNGNDVSKRVPALPLTALAGCQLSLRVPPPNIAQHVPYTAMNTFAMGYDRSSGRRDDQARACLERQFALTPAMMRDALSIYLPREADYKRKFHKYERAVLVQSTHNYDSAEDDVRRVGNYRLGMSNYTHLLPARMLGRRPPQANCTRANNFAAKYEQEDDGVGLRPEDSDTARELWLTDIENVALDADDYAHAQRHRAYCHRLWAQRLNENDYTRAAGSDPTHAPPLSSVVDSDFTSEQNVFRVSAPAARPEDVAAAAGAAAGAAAADKEKDATAAAAAAGSGGGADPARAAAEQKKPAPAAVVVDFAPAWRCAANDGGWWRCYPPHTWHWTEAQAPALPGHGVHPWEPSAYPPPLSSYVIHKEPLAEQEVRAYHKHYADSASCRALYAALRNQTTRLVRDWYERHEQERQDNSRSQLHYETDRATELTAVRLGALWLWCAEFFLLFVCMRLDDPKLFVTNHSRTVGLPPGPDGLPAYTFDWSDPAVRFDSWKPVTVILWLAALSLVYALCRFGAVSCDACRTRSHAAAQHELARRARQLIRDYGGNGVLYWTPGERAAVEQLMCRADAWQSRVVSLILGVLAWSLALSPLAYAQLGPDGVFRSLVLWPLALMSASGLCALYWCWRTARRWRTEDRISGFGGWLMDFMTRERWHVCLVFFTPVLVATVQLWLITLRVTIPGMSGVSWHYVLLPAYVSFGFVPAMTALMCLGAFVYVNCCQGLKSGSAHRRRAVDDTLPVRLVFMSVVLGSLGASVAGWGLWLMNATDSTLIVISIAWYVGLGLVCLYIGARVASDALGGR